MPASGWAPAASQQMTRTFLLFDAAASPHAFHLLQFWLDEEIEAEEDTDEEDENAEREDAEHESEPSDAAPNFLFHPRV